MEIFIVHRDVPYEFGEIVGVFKTLKGAKENILQRIRLNTQED